MTKEITQIINNFSKGMISEPRAEDFSYAQVIKNFDAFSYGKKLVPHYTTANGNTNQATDKIKNFVVAKYSSATDFRVFGLGVISGGTKAKVFVNNSLVSNSWTALTNGSSSTGTSTHFNLFVYYHKTGLIYGSRDGTHIWACDPTDVAAFADTHQALTYTDIGQGLVHSKDDILYIPYFNSAGAAGAKSFIAKNNNGSWTTNALTLPDHLKPVSICEYGNFLAIACVPISGVGNSIVFLWDRNSSFATLSESIDWGEGNLQILEQVDGTLIGISILGTTATTLISKIIFRYYNGGSAKVFKQLISEAVYLTNDLPINKLKVNNYLYFFMVIKLNGTTQEGLWRLGKNVFSGEFALSLDRTPNNDTALTSGVLHGFIVYGDVVFISYTDNGTVKMNYAATSNNYTATSIYETLIINEGDSSKVKKLIGVTIMTEALPAGGQTVLKYKKDEETSYTTIFTNTTANSLSYSTTTIESTGITLPDFKEIAFRIESTGGVVITGLKYKLEVQEKDAY